MLTYCKQIFTLFLFLAAISCSSPESPDLPDPVVVEKEVKIVMDSMWSAMMNGDVDRYMNYYTTDAHILGTDPSEDWSKESFTTYYKNAVSKGFTGDHTVTNSLILVAPGGESAVANYNIRFPSLLQHGDVRFSHHLVHTDAGWACNFLNIAIIPPNGKVAAIDSILGVKN